MTKKKKLKMKIFNIMDLPESLTNSIAKLHSESDSNCKLCLSAEQHHGISPTEVRDAIPFMKRYNIPPCVWALGFVTYQRSCPDCPDCKDEAKIIKEWVQQEERMHGYHSRIFDKLLIEIDLSVSFSK